MVNYSFKYVHATCIGPIYIVALLLLFFIIANNKCTASLSAHLAVCFNVFLNMCYLLSQ